MLRARCHHSAIRAHRAEQWRPPHRSEGFKLSTDPFFIEKLRDVVGLYLNPPDNALVICVDEKSQCQVSRPGIRGGC